MYNSVEKSVSQQNLWLIAVPYVGYACLLHVYNCPVSFSPFFDKTRCMHTQMHPHIHTQTHRHKRTERQTHTYLHHTDSQSDTHTQTHIHKQTVRHTHRHTNTNVCTYTERHAHTPVTHSYHHLRIGLW